MNLSSHPTPLARILVVDDEPNIRLPLVRALELTGYDAASAESGDGALEMIQAAHYDLMVLDIRMPGLDGTLVMGTARQICPDLAILILTGHATLQSAIAAVKSEAIDYLLKPIGIQEIITAIGGALRKRHRQARHQELIHTAVEALRAAEILDAPASPPPVVAPTEKSSGERFRRVGALTLDRDKRLVIVNSTPARTALLTEGEMTILELLVDAQGKPISCQQLAHSAWQLDLSEVEAESLARPYIFRLRQKIEVNPRDPLLICTIRGRGYFLASS